MAKCGLETCVTFQKRDQNNICDTTSLIFFRLNAKCDTTCHCYATVMSEERRHGRRRDTRVVCAWEGGQSSEWRSGLAKTPFLRGGVGESRGIYSKSRGIISVQRLGRGQSKAGGGGEISFNFGQLDPRRAPRQKKYKKKLKKKPGFTLQMGGTGAKKISTLGLKVVARQFHLLWSDSCVG